MPTRKVTVDVPDVQASLKDVKALVKGLKDVAKAQSAVASASRQAGTAAKAAAQSTKSAASRMASGGVGRPGSSSGGGASSAGGASATVDPNKTQAQSVRDAYRMKAQYARVKAKQQVADQKAAAKAAKVAQQNDPAYIRKQALMRARYTYGKNGKIQAHLLGVDIQKLVNSGQGALVHQVMGGNDPQVGGGIDPSSMGLNVANAATGAIGTAGQGAAGAYSTASAVASALTGLSRLGPYAAAAAVVLKGLGASAEYAQKRVEGEARAGMGYDPLLEKYGGYGGSAGYTGVAAAAAGRAGINPVGGPYGNIDFSGNKRKELKYIGDASSFDEARRRDIELHGGETGAAKFWDLTPQQKAAALTDMDKASENDDRMMHQPAARRRAEHNQASENWDRFVGGLADAGTNAADKLINWLIGSEGQAGGWSGSASEKKSGGGSKDLKEALDENTKAINRQTQAIDTSTSGFSSSVPGAEGSVPRGLRNNLLLQANGMDMATATSVRLNTGL